MLHFLKSCVKIYALLSAAISKLGKRELSKPLSFFRKSYWFQFRLFKISIWWSLFMKYASVYICQQMLTIAVFLLLQTAKTRSRTTVMETANNTVLFDDTAFCSVAFEKLYNKALSCMYLLLSFVLNWGDTRFFNEVDSRNSDCWKCFSGSVSIRVTEW